jgi:hypothetical protein
MLKKRSQKNIPTDGSNTRSELTFLCFVSDSRRQQKKTKEEENLKYEKMFCIC